MNGHSGKMVARRKLSKEIPEENVSHTYSSLSTQQWPAGKTSFTGDSPSNLELHMRAANLQIRHSGDWLTDTPGAPETAADIWAVSLETRWSWSNSHSASPPRTLCLGMTSRKTKQRLFIPAASQGKTVRASVLGFLTNYFIGLQQKSLQFLCYCNLWFDTGTHS